MVDEMLLNAHPIPGSSLTREPGNSPWEQPPKFVKLKDVVDYYSEKLVKPESISMISQAVTSDIAIMDLAQVMIKTGVMRGIHTIDVGILSLPIIVELIKSIAEMTDSGYIVDSREVQSIKQIDEATMIKVMKEAVSNVKKEVEPIVKKGLMAKSEGEQQ